jgi:hypothetical protein
MIMSNASTIDTGFIVLEHDLFEQCVDIATGYILPDALARSPKLTIKPVVQCLNKPIEYAYVETNNNDTNPPPVASAASSTPSNGAPSSTKSRSPGSSGASGSAGSSNSGASGSSSAASKVALLSPGALPAFVTAMFGVVAGAAMLS